MRPTRITVFASLALAAVACGIDAVGALPSVELPNDSSPSSSSTSSGSGAGTDGAVEPTDGDGSPTDAAVDATDVTVVTMPVLELTQSAPGTSVDLTTEGVIDWAHFGGNGSVVTTRKNVVNVISNLDITSQGNIGATVGYPTSFTWSDGKPGTTPPTDTFAYGKDSPTPSRFVVRVPSGPTKRTFVVWVGGNLTRGRLTATLSNTMLTPATAEFENQNMGYGVKFTIGFVTPVAAELSVEWRLVQAYSGDSVRFAGAALR